MLSELDKLEKYLKEHKYIFFRRIDKPAIDLRRHAECMEGFGNQHQIIVYDNRAVRQWDAICQWGSYGYEDGLLEIYGSIVDNEKDGDSVVGHLTAQDVINRLEAT